MTNAPRWRRYLRFARPNVAADVDEELAFHLEMRIQRNRALGMSEEAARREALRRFGDVTLVRESLVDHDTRKGQAETRRELLADVIQDLRFGLRSLRRAPGFTTAAVLTLALCIGANASIYSVIDAVLLRPLPFAHPEELVSLGMGSGGEFNGLRERLRGYAQLAAYASQTHPVDDGREAIRIQGAAITPNLLATLGVMPMLGRGFVAEEGTPGNNTALLLSHGMWQRQFGGRRDIVGRRVLVEGAPFTIVGVMPPEFHFPDAATQYWHPYAFNPANVGYYWSVAGISFIGRVARGVTVAQANRETREVWPTLRTLNPLWEPGPEYRQDVRVVPLQDSMVGSSARVLWILFASVVAVLLVGCVNVANLLLARATARARELSVRAALGGGRSRLIRQLVTESLLLSGVGALLGVGVAYAAMRWAVSVLPEGVPRAHEISLNAGVLMFTALVSIATGLLFGIIPALRATRFASAGASNGGVRTTAGTSHQRVSGILVAAEMTLAVVLVVGATLLARSLSALRDVNPGFQTTHVIAARITPPSVTYAELGRTSTLYTTLLERLSAIPGVLSVAAVDKLPIAQTVWGVATRVEGQFEDASHPLPEVSHWQMITPRYFETMRIPVRGRDFTTADRPDQIPVAIVSESVARRFWPKGDAIGKRIGYPYQSPWLTIVGVVPDTRQDSLRDTTSTSMYVPWQQRTRMSGNEMWMLIRSAGDPQGLTTAIRRVVQEVDRSVPVSDVRTMDAVLEGSVDKARFTTVLVGAFAFAALLLGAIGIYGVMSYLVSQRTQEMGIRIALGAPVVGVIGLVIARGAKLALAGAAAGVVAAFFATRSLDALLFGVTARDPLTYVGVPALFVLVAVAASLAPARRATRVDPIRALRAD